MREVVELADRVMLDESGEEGVAVGVAKYLYGEDQVLVRYKAADGRQVEAWWGVSAVSKIEN